MGARKSAVNKPDSLCLAQVYTTEHLGSLSVAAGLLSCGVEVWAYLDHVLPLCSSVEADALLGLFLYLAWSLYYPLLIKNHPAPSPQPTPLLPPLLYPAPLPRSTASLTLGIPPSSFLPAMARALVPEEAIG